jgi:DNA recombination protein RmuC
MVILSIICAALALLSVFLLVRLLVQQEQLRSARKEIEIFGQTELRLKDIFKGLAATTLESSTQHFLEIAQTRQQSIDDLLKPVSQALSQYQEQMSAMEKDRQRSFATIDAELKRVADLSLTLGRETSSLKDALKRPHVRGRWGELQLKNCIELAGMSEHADVVMQDATTDQEGGVHIPDMVVRMPGGRQVVVDAKTPIEAFISSLEAPSDDQRVAQMVRHANHVKEHVRQLSSRSYQSVLKNTPDFTVMFLPNESFLYAALEQQPDLIEYALQRKILIATPPTLIGLLKVIRYGWNEERLAENAQKISEVGVELHKRLCDFVDAYDKVGKFLDKAKEEYVKGKTRLQSRVIVQAQRFESLGVRSSKSLGEISEGLHPPEENSRPPVEAAATDLDGPTI